MERRPKPGEFYRHFKNKLYQVIAVAVHSETGEEMVVYQALYGDYGCYVRPLSMFVSEVDREKYPGVTQKYRFEQVEPGTEKTVAKEQEPAGSIQTPDQALEQEPNPLLLRFLEAESLEDKMACIKQMAGKVGQKELNSMYLVLDMPEQTGSIPEQLEQIYRCLETQFRYDGDRLRNR